MIYFIYNPNSGSKGTLNSEQILSKLNKIPNSKVLITQYPNHATEFVNEILPLNPERIIAIGGDGTINEVAKNLIGTQIPLGIIPKGSGNGLARHLDLYKPFDQALEIALKSQNFINSDVAYFNNKPFFCTAGIGFDAAVANDFSKSKTRGFINYIISSFRINNSYQSIEVKFENDKFFEPYFSITFANANQFGNHAYISPGSNLTDQNFELIKIKPINFFKKIQLGISLFLKTIENQNFVELSSTSNCKLKAKGNGFYHLDGEIGTWENLELNVSIQSEALKIIIPN
ncbi:hypothetical protein EOJ36_02290 [Sandaracinomonas limnophila]|uniref:DAGKc domain-containing protein n=1 Tax=Sandaracinomonas limnophila TaxID=1862386 RepID=A0A437PX47_9BACT|nr:diacylglycerol kinase family protein [Sandaracinomonas limnophila]RVU26846.1 hypothetical protein EOJ36_02290 [Sandaracinomonas limnophila]